MDEEDFLPDFADLMQKKQTFFELMQSLFKDQYEIVRGGQDIIAFCGQKGDEDAVNFLVDVDEETYQTIRTSFGETMEVQHVLQVADELPNTDTIGELLTFVDETLGDHIDTDAARQKIEEHLQETQDQLEQV
jgi:hypothetical protein